GTKGVEFPQFWMTVLTDFATRHRLAVLQAMGRAADSPSRQIDFTSLLGTVAINLLAQEPHGPEGLIALYQTHSSPEVRLKVLNAMAELNSPVVKAFCRAEFNTSNQTQLKDDALKALAK